MDVTAITNTAQNTYVPPVPTNDTTPAATSNTESPAAVYDKNGTQNYKIDPKAIKAALEEVNNSAKRLQLLVEKLFGNQANQAQKAGGMQWTKAFWESLEVDEATRLEAEKEIGEDGYFGVKQTSERILNFAKAISGGDPSKIEMLRDAVKQGFDEAEKMWGDKLPQISYDTLDAVMKGFDEWAASAKTPADPK